MDAFADYLLISLWCTTCLAEEASKFQRGCCLHIILRSNGSYNLKVLKAMWKTHGDRAIPHAGLSQGNTLPLAIKSIWNIQSFKEVLMNFLFHVAFTQTISCTVYDFVLKCWRGFILLFFGFGVAITSSISTCWWWNRHVAITRRGGP